MSEIDLQERFPNLRPIESAPSLGTINGVGTMMYGARDHDRETGTYVKTHCFTFLFVPILTLGAYRVADAPGGGWYFVGKEPLSGLAKGWNFLLLAGILCGVGFGYWSSVYNSDDAKAGRAIAAAERMADEGDLDGAAAEFHRIGAGLTKHAPRARQALHDLLEKAVADGDTDEARKVLEIVVGMHLAGTADWGTEVPERGVALASRLQEDDPAAALEVLDRVADVASDEPRPENERSVRETVLQKLVAADPGNVEYAASLAVMIDENTELDTDNRTQRCEALLAPLSEKLGSTEGARILGRIRAAQDRFEEAYALLQPYCGKRLAGLHAAEEALKNAGERARNRIDGMMQSGNVPTDVQLKVRNARGNDERVQQVLIEWFSSEMSKDAGLREARRNMMKSAVVVPVALDLGMVLLQRGRAATDPDERQREFERAEETFVAIQGVAGEDAFYKMQFAQVQYWLGKQDEGRKLFEEVLESTNRESTMLLGVGRTYRELGDQERARALFEEAYENADEEDQKHTAAMMRSLTNEDLEDRIAWLRKADPEQNEVRASLADTLGDRDLRDGNEREAERNYREALRIYDELPESDSTLNNSAIVLGSLYTITDDPEHLRESIRRLERALRLNPSHAILTSNVGSGHRQVALLDLVGKEITPAALRFANDVDTLSFLYDDAATADEIRERVRTHPGMTKANGLLRKATLLAPNRSDHYQVEAEYHSFVNDPEGLATVLASLDGVALDTTRAAARFADFVAGRDDDELHGEARKTVERVRREMDDARTIGGATRAVMAATLARSLLYLSWFEPVDPDEIVALGEEAVEARPSVGSRWTRTTALFHRANVTLIANNPGYAAFVEGGERSIDAVNLLALAAVDDETLRPAVLANPDVRAALEEIAGITERDPNECRTFQWALLSVDAPAAAEPVAEILREDRTGRLSNAVRAFTSPHAAPISEYWYLRIDGRDDEADQLLSAAARKGTPLPAGLGLGN